MVWVQNNDFANWKKNMNEINELFTIRDYLRWTVSRFNEASLFYGHGTESAWDEAVALILHTLHLAHNTEPSILDARLTTPEREAIYKIVQRRIKERIPVPYLTHEAWFKGMAFYVDERVLVPRSPIAELITNEFTPWLEIDSVHSILDLCTGSGCIAIACAKQFPHCEVDASDISPDALAVAKMNVLRHEVEDQVHLHQADLFNGLPEKKYDLILSNPPYVDADDMAMLPPEFLHEPKLGLASGPDGLNAVINILQNAAKYLNPNGTLIVEVGNSEYALIEKFPDAPFTWFEFQNGGGGVFMLTAEQLTQYHDVFSS
jgi:ribosomal protein L3 glutamine methyltransferase